MANEHGTTSTPAASASDIRVLRLPGPRAVQTNVAAFHEQIRPHMQAAVPRVVIDFTNVEFVDSAFLGALVVELKRAVAKGGDIKVCSLQRPVRSLFDMLRLDRVFDIQPSRDIALDASKP